MTMLGGYFVRTLRQRDRAVKPLLSEFQRLFEQFAARYGHTKSGERFLEAVSKPTLILSRMDKGVNDFMNAGQDVYNLVTDPGNHVVRSACAAINTDVRNHRRLDQSVHGTGRESQGIFQHRGQKLTRPGENLGKTHRGF